MRRAEHRILGGHYTVSVLKSLYKTDPVELPRYTLSEAANYLRISKHSLKKWVYGKEPAAFGATAQKPLIQRPDPDDPRLSFANLLEAYSIGFSQYLRKLSNAGRGSKDEMPEILEAYLQRIERDLSGTPLRMFPITRLDYRDAPKLVTIDPVVAFGRRSSNEWLSKPLLSRSASTQESP